RWRRVKGVARFVPASLVNGSPLAPPLGVLSPRRDPWETTDYRMASYVVMRPVTLEQWYAILLGELISQGLGGRARRCELPRCRLLFVNTVRRGKRRRFCCNSNGPNSRGTRLRRRGRKR